MAKEVEEDVELSSVATMVDVGTLATVEDGTSSDVAVVGSAVLAGRVTPFWRAHSLGSRPCGKSSACFLAKKDEPWINSLSRYGKAYLRAAVTIDQTEVGSRAVI